MLDYNDPEVTQWCYDCFWPLKPEDEQCPCCGSDHTIPVPERPVIGERINPMSDDLTHGQRAAAAIREAKALLSDPAKAEYHRRLSAAIDAMQGELDFWNQLAAVNRLVDIANERG